MPQTAITFQSNKLPLEGVVTLPDGFTPPYPAAVLCHHHPAFGGSMEHPVVLAIARALDQRGMATLRFNFRSVDGSQGAFSSGQEEQRDVLAALEVLMRWPSVQRRRVALVGYSLGAQAILQGLGSLKGAVALALISPPLHAFEGSPVGKDRRPRLLIVGERDRLVGAQALREVVDAFERPAQLVVSPGADHTWRGHEPALAELVAAFLAQHLA
ncbi:MAG: dienelactone hydrolase family protein [Chloroflexi bacterium]|nr:dienelactone hydrolase family protein [Chloroflexota bacterium]